MTTLLSTSDALVAVADAILQKKDALSTIEISKKGRKYKFVNNNFQRIREEDKHLIVHPEDLSLNLSTVSAYRILDSISSDIFSEFRDVCLTIIGVARDLEVNGWYEEENSSVINHKVSRLEYSPEEREKALSFVQGVTKTHLIQGYNLLYCAKLNFLHTDHHIGTKLEGHYMRNYVQEYFGEEALESPTVLVALKSFVHWANIKGFLYKLEVPNIDISKEEEDSFRRLPDPCEELLCNVYDRYPSGMSKYSLIRKSFDIIADSPFSKLIPYPEGDVFDLTWLYDLCHDIEEDPARYHLRSVVKRLSKHPVNLNELNQEKNANVKSLLAVLSLILNTVGETGGDFLLQNSKIPKFSQELIDEMPKYYKQLVDISDKIEEYRYKGWSPSDIILRLQDKTQKCLYDEVMKMRDLHAEDYESE
ncbi:hypothetical protein A9F13_22g00759 [Clavispora lusitaniae]|uniref:Uncharacterized protein n=1 Tax=Clavispora lusitaniae TaxID=36911 RepID=A0AA91PVK8_CLALS|nr:hypothetical protein A9F13_22g00759 [Clavispora lusitaniae]